MCLRTCEAKRACTWHLLPSIQPKQNSFYREVALHCWRRVPLLQHLCFLPWKNNAIWSSYQPSCQLWGATIILLNPAFVTYIHNGEVQYSSLSYKGYKFEWMHWHTNFHLWNTYKLLWGPFRQVWFWDQIITVSIKENVTSGLCWGGKQTICCSAEKLQNGFPYLE